jgi:hypothetical protein
MFVSKVRSQPEWSTFGALLNYGCKKFYIIGPRVNYYSGVGTYFNDVATGNAKNDNVATLIKRRFLMANVGDEELSCNV